jgi:hypothetical protein
MGSAVAMEVVVVVGEERVWCMWHKFNKVKFEIFGKSVREVSE